MDWAVAPQTKYNRFSSIYFILPALLDVLLMSNNDPTFAPFSHLPIKRILTESKVTENDVYTTVDLLPYKYTTLQINWP